MTALFIEHFSADVPKSCVLDQPFPITGGREWRDFVGLLARGHGANGIRHGPVYSIGETALLRRIERYGSVRHLYSLRPRYKSSIWLATLV
jgi:hypothetical protein